MDRNNLRYYLIVFVIILSINFAESKDNCDDFDILSEEANRISDGENQLLKNIYSSLSYYEIQKYKNDFNLNNNDVLKKYEISQKLEITQNNLEEVLNRIKSLEIVDLTDFNKLTLSKSEVEKLSYILDLTLNRNVTTLCTQTEVVIIGHFISLKSLKELSKISNDCEKLSLETMESIRFYSFDTIYIDKDFDLNEEPFKNVKNVNFIAPKFQVIGNRKLTFDAFGYEKGVSFFGVAGRIIDKHNLQISARNEINDLQDIDLFDLEEDSYTKDNIIYVKNSEGRIVEFKDVISKYKIVKDYQSYFRENFDSDHREYHHLDFLEKLYRVSNFYDFSNILDLYEELKELGKDSGTEMDFSLFYQILLDKIGIHAQFFKGSKNSDDFLLLRCLYAATLSLKNQLHTSSLVGLITDVPEHFKRLKDEFDELLEEIKNGVELDLKKKIRTVIKQRIKNFDKSIEEEIRVANETISVKIMEELKTINGQLNNSMSALVDEVSARQKMATEAAEELVKKKSDLFKDACLQTAFGVLNIVATGLSYAGPIGMAAGSLLNTGSTIAQAFVADDKADRDAKLQKIIPNLTKNVEELKERVEAKKLKELENLEEAVESVEKDADFNKMKLKREDEEKLKNSLKNRKEEIKTLKKDIKKVSFENIKDIKKQVFGKIKDKCMKFIQPDKLDNFLEKLSVVSEASSLAADIYNTWNGYAENNKLVDGRIAANQEIMNGLKDFKESVNTDIMPDLEKLVNKVSEAVENIATKSKVDFSLVKFDAEKIFAKTKKYLNSVISGTYKMKDSLMETIDKLQNLLPILLNTNGVIQDFKQEKNLADLLAGISFEKMSDGNKHEETIKDLDIMIHSRILLKEYKIAYHALEQFTFPYIDKYLSITDQSSVFDIKGDIVSMVKNVREQIGEITKKLSLYREFIVLGVEDFRPHYFGRDVINGFELIPPFYIWKNEDHKDTIAKLLSGQEVILYADIDKKLPKFDGIKINGIEFYFRSRSREAELNRTLNGFDISFQHLGNSYYSLNGETYMIKTANLAFHYSFLYKDQDNGLYMSNYQKLRHGDFMISPYAMWKVVLENYNNSFDELMQYEDVDLELKGHGIHVNFKTHVDNSLNYKNVKLCKKSNEGLSQGGKL